MIWFSGFTLTDAPQWALDFMQRLMDMARAYLISQGVTITGGEFKVITGEDDDNEQQS